jgi:hypothetical protein
MARLTDAEPRFDVYFSDKCYIEYHFCREWDDEGGCFGTNPHHGFSFDEAKAQVAEWYERQAKEWREMTLNEWEVMHGYEPTD